MQKQILLLFMTLSSLVAMAQRKSRDMQTLLSNKEAIQEVVTHLFTGPDERDWGKVHTAFADEVLLDYTSLVGGEPAKVSPQQITDNWKTILPGFQFTQHTISNFEIAITGKEATVFHYGTAQHYLENASGDNLWVVVGTYNHHLINTSEGWKVDQMKFNFKFMHGNTDLPQMAQDRVAGKVSEAPVNVGARNKATVRMFFQLLEEENIDAFLDLFGAEGKQVNPYASGLLPAGAENPDALKAYWEPVPGYFDGMKFPIEEIYAMEDPSMVYVKYKGIIKLKNDAGYYENNYYSTFKFNDAGKILEYVEIFNPIVAARGFGLLDQIK